VQPAAVRPHPLNVTVALPGLAAPFTTAVVGAGQGRTYFGVVGAGADDAAVIVGVKGGHVDGGARGAVQRDAVDCELQQPGSRA